MSTALKFDRDYMNLIVRFPLVPIRSKEQSKKASSLVRELASRLAELTPGERDYLNVLGNLLAEYEKKTCKLLVERMSPSEALAYLLEQSGRNQSDVVRATSIKQPNLSAYLSGTRLVSRDAAVKLGKYFKVSAELFLPRA